MRSMGSAHASVRSSDGLCQRHDRYLQATSYCAEHEPRAQPSAQQHIRR
jgi:hypothetical protein